MRRIVTVQSTTAPERSANGGSNAPDRQVIMSFAHAIIWLDHRDARVVGFSIDASRTVEFHSQVEGKIHHRANTIGSGHLADDHHFFDEIAEAVRGVHEVVVCGPGNAKTAFMTYVGERHPDTARQIIGVETQSHPSDAELLAWAKKYFKAVDQLGLTSAGDR
jgi:hypothetical protein